MFSKRQRSERTELVQTDPSLLYQGESDFHLSVPAHHTLATLPRHNEGFLFRLESGESCR